MEETEKGTQDSLSYGSQLSGLMLFFGIGWVLALFMTLGIMHLLGITEGIESMRALSPGKMLLLKGAQVLTSLLTFLFPVVGFVLSMDKKFTQYLTLNRSVWFPQVAILPFMLLTVSPIIIILVIFNTQLMEMLPNSLQWMVEQARTAEKESSALIQIYLGGSHWTTLVTNLVMIALVPAFVEELFFRGTLQPLLTKWWKRPHLAIIVTAVLFSYIHFQFFGFLGRWAMGIWLGYLFFWSKNIWYPIIAHILNNGLLVLAIYWGKMDIPDATAMQNDITPAQAGMSFILLTALSFVFVRLQKKREESF